MTTVDLLHIYVDTELKHRWSYVAANGPILGDSDQGYKDIRDCRRGFSILNRAALPSMPLYQLDACPKHDGARCLVWQIVRRDEHWAGAQALRNFTPRCPVHGAWDEPGCRMVEYLRNQLEQAADEHEQQISR